jgi:predicted aldo/keto reductase-like oxidoreductase
MPYVRLGTSGLKISKIILGCMTYGSPEWAGWVLGEEEAFKHIKAAYDAGINTFDTANVTYTSARQEDRKLLTSHLYRSTQTDFPRRSLGGRSKSLNSLVTRSW